LIPPGKTGEVVAEFDFKGRDIEELRRPGRRYARHVLPCYIRPEAMEGMMIIRY